MSAPSEPIRFSARGADPADTALVAHAGDFDLIYLPDHAVVHVAWRVRGRRLCCDASIRVDDATPPGLCRTVRSWLAEHGHDARCDALRDYALGLDRAFGALVDLVGTREQDPDQLSDLARRLVALGERIDDLCMAADEAL